MNKQLELLWKKLDEKYNELQKEWNLLNCSSRVCKSYEWDFHIEQQQKINAKFQMINEVLKMILEVCNEIN